VILKGSEASPVPWLEAPGRVYPRSAARNSPSSAGHRAQVPVAHAHPHLGAPRPCWRMVPNKHPSSRNLLSLTPLTPSLHSHIRTRFLSLSASLGRGELSLPARGAGTHSSSWPPAVSLLVGQISEAQFARCAGVGAGPAPLAFKGRCTEGVLEYKDGHTTEIGMHQAPIGYPKSHSDSTPSSLQCSTAHALAAGPDDPDQPRAPGLGIRPRIPSPGARAPAGPRCFQAAGAGVREERAVARERGEPATRKPKTEGTLGQTPAQQGAASKGGCPPQDIAKLGSEGGCPPLPTADGGVVKEGVHLRRVLSLAVKEGVHPPRQSW